MRWMASLLIVGCAWADFPPAFYVENAAGGSGFAPGSIIDIGGFNLADEIRDRTTIIVTLQPTGTPQALQASLLSPPGIAFRIWALVPNSMPLGQATITLYADGSPKRSGTITITATAPGLFTTAYYGAGPALAQNVAQGSASLNQLTNPALPGQLVTLWGTGLGISTTADVTIDVAGVSVPVSFAGRAPGLPGVDQINFQLPLNSPTGCYVPITLHAGGIPSNSVTLSVNPTPGACAHPLGLTYSDLQPLDNGGRVPVGSVSLSWQPPPAAWDLITPNGGVLAWFVQWDALGIFNLAQTQAPPVFGCHVTTGLGATGGLAGSDYNAGNQLTLSDPRGTLSIMTGYANQYRLNWGTGAPLPSPGQWQISAPGGRDIGSFSRSFILPPVPSLTNATQIAALPSDADVPVTWNAQGYEVSDFMTVQLGSLYRTTAGPPALDAILSCTVPATDGRVVISRALLDANGSLPTEISLSVSPFAPARTIFSVATTSGSTMRTVIDYTLRQLVAFPTARNANQ